MDTESVPTEEGLPASRTDNTPLYSPECLLPAETVAVASPEDIAAT